MWVNVLLGLLKKIPYQLWLLVGVLLSFWLYGVYQYERGQKHVQDQWDESRKLGQAIVEDLKLRANAVVTIIEERVVTETKVIHEKADTIIKEIPVYIPVDTPDLPGGFRLLHDAAATSRLPNETTTSGSPVPVADAARTITLNYESFHLCRSSLRAWEDWYQEQLLVWQTAQHK